MAKKISKAERQETRERIIDAWLELTKEGQATIPLLAKKLGQSDGWVYGYFSSQFELYRATVQRELQRVDDTVTEPTNSLRDDLIGLARRYHAHFAESPFLMLMILEIASVPKLQGDVDEYQTETKKRLIAFYEHHRDGWCDAVRDAEGEEILELLSVPFLGGIFARVLWSQIGVAAKEFEPTTYVDAFLRGYGSQAKVKKIVGGELIQAVCDVTGLDPFDVGKEAADSLETR